MPTMGALHDGHISLVRGANKECEHVVVSIFVNPLQFNNAHDLAQYPRTLEVDLKKLEQENVSIVFAPSMEEAYQQTTMVSMHFGALEEVLEGAKRPGHFNGVGIIVSKLFNWVQPDMAFFGLKDLQQCMVIQTLVNDLGFPLELVFCPTLREQSGLAMSSRNQRLSQQDRMEAGMIYTVLKSTKDLILYKESIQDAKAMAKEMINRQPNFTLEYLELVQLPSMQTISEGYKGKCALCIAVYINDVRIIDNIDFELT